MTLVNSSADHAHAAASIRERMQWLQGAGFDFLSSGTLRRAALAGFSCWRWPCRAAHPPPALQRAAFPSLPTPTTCSC